MTTTATAVVAVEELISLSQLNNLIKLQNSKIY